MKRLLILALCLALASCATVPPVADPATADRLAAAILQTRGQTCAVTGYKFLGHVASWEVAGMFTPQARALNMSAGVPADAYAVECDRVTAWLVHLPDPDTVKPWTMQCDGRGVFRGGGCTFRSDK